MIKGHGRKTMFDQQEYDIRCEWSQYGAATLSPSCDAIVIVDILSFSTAVSIAVSRGAIIFPCRWKDKSKLAFAKSKNAELAGPRNNGSYSLSPLSLITVKPGQRIVLPSPNGATISFSTGNTPTYAGCLRNAQVVAKAALRHGKRIGVIPCGERWNADFSLRPALEDLIGAGAIINHLTGTKSPEAKAALQVFYSAKDTLFEVIRACSSGKELIERNHEDDISLSCQYNTDTAAPRLVDEAYQAVE
jgi:2-phosphosulfolactate phosphatase